MVTDNERREVAHNIMENYVCGGLGYKVASAYNIAVAIGMNPGLLVGDIELWERLADLIDPDSTIPTDPGEAAIASVEGFIREMRHSTEEEQNEYGTMLKKMSVELYPVDRDALLELADEIDANVDRLLEDSSLIVEVLGLMRCYSNRIRKVLGETRME